MHSAGPSKLSKSSIAHIEYPSDDFHLDDRFLEQEEDGDGDECESMGNREAWTPETSPTSSEISSTSTDSQTTNSNSSSPKQSIRISTSPSSSSSLLLNGPPSLKAPKSPTMHPYRPTPRNVPKPRGLMPLSTINHSSNLPKSQPLARTLFTRMINDGGNTPHAGLLTSGKKTDSSKKTKIIVPTKPLRTTFELGLTASELARKT